MYKEFFWLAFPCCKNMGKTYADFKGQINTYFLCCVWGINKYRREEKELGKCIHQWTTNDEKNTKKHFRHLVSSSGKRQTDNNKKKKEIASFFFLLSVSLLLPDKDTKSRKCLFVFFSSFIFHWWVHFLSSFSHVSTSPAVTHFSSKYTLVCFLVCDGLADPV